ncbi:MAG: CRISPR-associated endonuclease Cas2 [Alphaproteobacteria bacterium]|nr:MAG: CRISPR-associated endonuclease Cas2 [Alphaproteobacteria bacterium]
MWMMVIFDLPTGTKRERGAAAKFRNKLLDMGFEMAQFSVYMRFCGDRSKLDPYIKKVKACAPKNGKVSILMFTDKQFSDTINIYNRDVSRPAKEPEQIVLF